jgi:hypothetical protein
MKASAKAISGRGWYSRQTTSLSYEKLIPDDRPLAPLFANLWRDQLRRVASWLGEVLGGLPAYSDAPRGYRPFERWTRAGVSP